MGNAVHPDVKLRNTEQKRVVLDALYWYLSDLNLEGTGADIEDKPMTALTLYGGPFCQDSVGEFGSHVGN